MNPPPDGSAPVTGAERPARILVCDDDPDIRRLVCAYLELEGFEVQEASDGNQAVEKTASWRPDLVLMDVMMPNKSGTDALTEIREDFRTAYIPVVFLTAKSMVGDKVGHLLAGADDYIVKPFDPQELVARVEVALRRSQALRGLNPLTGLPGNTVIGEEISRRLSSKKPFACLYADLDNFKAFNDHYGFSRGDELIKVLAGVILGVLRDQEGVKPFAGHVGGDDFVALCDPDVATEVAQQMCDRFDAEALPLYDPEDRKHGYIEVSNRRGVKDRFPFATVSIGVVGSQDRRFGSAAEVAEVAAEMKGFAKRDQGSSWAVDRRRD